ncbi:hypothetical protein TRFO_29290 [Tritrichomonas foetus]|uniref:Uncharacterized protein n=1 Tax=Tritrichomonas foetus TaxID=1144522 RepID=A0A1J4JXC4_9EUKA|nr:hypothetical protein TRFO_29290 [Tritrichomonas foetus]|eukprot:OHT03314.1 hypothetical protein TRFO_29290 [Tritrichomonas foetus]
MTLDIFSTISQRNTNPGPGAYSTESYRSVGEKYSIKCNIRPKYGTKPPLTSEIDFPKEYSSMSKRGKTISPKYKTRQSEPTPGPEYLPDPREQFSKSVCIKKKYEDPDTSMYPGPGTYSPGELSKTRVPPMCGRSKIVLSDVPDSPGPAAYDVLHKFGGNPRYSIRPKTAEIADRSLNLGIAHNNPPKLGEDTPSWTIPKSGRDDEKDRKVPGPGTYEQDRPRTSKLAPYIRPKTPMKAPEFADVPLENTSVFPKIKQKTIGIKTESDFWGGRNRNPGPSYMPGSALSRRSYTIGEKFKIKDNMETPGPSDYNPHDTRLPREPIFTVKGPMSRDDWLPNEKGLPGPGQFNLRSEPPNPKWIIGERSISRTNRSRSSQRDLLTSRKAKSSLK